MYSLMFYSFEIQNDMQLSVNIYQMLQAETDLNCLEPIAQHWIAEGHFLNQSRISSFGNCKINQAQIVRDYDQALSTLKQQEVQQMKKGMAANSDGLAGQGKYHAECIRYARFYLDQFFNYLTLALQSEAKNAAGSSSVAYASNEEKVKEMWEKLCYSLTKAETSETLSLVQHIFCTLAAFQALSKSYFDTFVLRKLDFEKIMKSVSDRLRTISDDMKN